MAGDWLKMECSTPDKAEVLAITAAMGWDDPDLAVGKLFRVWRWFDQQTVNGDAAGVTSALLDRIAGVAGFAKAMQSVGWLVIADAGLTLPNFDRHNGKTAKTRALTANRMRDLRSSDAGSDAGGVTNSVPREEKRREEKRESKASRRRSRADTPLFALDSIEVEAAKHLFARMLENNPSAREPNWQAWARDFYLIFRVDGRSPSDVKRIIEWSQRDPFWMKNILSPKALRKQIDRLTLLANDGSGSGRRDGAPKGAPPPVETLTGLHRADEIREAARSIKTDLRSSNGDWPHAFTRATAEKYIAHVSDINLDTAPTIEEFIAAGSS